MYTFAIAVMLGFGVFAVASFLGHYLGFVKLPGFHMAMLLALGIGAAWLSGFNVWAQWGEAVRWDWVGVTFTGVMIAAAAHLARHVVGMVEGYARKANDEAESLEQASLRSVA